MGRDAMPGAGVPEGGDAAVSVPPATGRISWPRSSAKYELAENKREIAEVQRRIREQVRDEGKAPREAERAQAGAEEEAEVVALIARSKRPRGSRRGATEHARDLGARPSSVVPPDPAATGSTRDALIGLRGCCLLECRLQLRQPWTSASSGRIRSAARRGRMQRTRSRCVRRLTTTEPRRHGHEDPDGPDLARSTRCHGPQDRFLAGGVRGAVLRVQRRGRRADAGVTEGWPAAGRPEER